MADAMWRGYTGAVRPCCMTWTVLQHICRDSCWLCFSTWAGYETEKRCWSSSGSELLRKAGGDMIGICVSFLMLFVVAE